MAGGEEETRIDIPAESRVDEGPQELGFNEFDMKNIPIDATILVFGRRKSGKGVLMLDMMFYLRKRLDTVVGMNPTEAGSKTLAPFTPPAFIYDDFDEQKLREIVMLQVKAVSSSTLRGRRRYRRIAIVLDDISSDTRRMKSEVIRDIFLQGRHRKILFIAAIQNMMNFPSDLRDCTDLVFAFRTPIAADRQRLYEHYFGVFETYSVFDKVFRNLTEGYGCMVLDNRSRTMDPTRCIYYYEADLRPVADYLGLDLGADLRPEEVVDAVQRHLIDVRPIEVGDPWFWKASEDRMRKTVDDFDPEAIVKHGIGGPAVGGGGARRINPRGSIRVTKRRKRRAGEDDGESVM